MHAVNVEGTSAGQSIACVLLSTEDELLIRVCFPV